MQKKVLLLLSILFPSLVLEGCVTHTAIGNKPFTTPEEPLPGQFDPAVLGQDVLGLAAAAERLCQPLLSREQNKLGHALAERALGMGSNNPNAALAVARCAALLLDFLEGKDRERMAETGVIAARSIGVPEKNPITSYWFAICLGQILRERGMSGLSLLSEEIKALKTAQEEPSIDLGGPSRVLGMLYLKAPGWPAGPGDHDAALELLSEVASQYPSHPLNHIFYGEALLATGDKKTAAQHFAKGKDLAREELWGDIAHSWQQQAQEQLDQLTK